MHPGPCAEGSARRWLHLSPDSPSPLPPAPNPSLLSSSRSAPISFLIPRRKLRSQGRGRRLGVALALMGRDVVFLLELLAAQIAGEPIGGVGVVLLHVPVEGGLLAAREAADLAPGWGAEQGGIWGGGERWGRVVLQGVMG